MPRVHVWIEGRVKGCASGMRPRRWPEDRRGGLVRNLSDGRVEAVFEGDREACEKALAWVRTGPPNARVSGVEARWEEDEEGLKGFRIRF